MKSKTRFIVIGLVMLVVLVFVVPLVINALYQSKIKLFITAWNAADVLGFYGNVLGASVTAIVLICTIVFTRKQIQHDRYLASNISKWNRLESDIMKILADVMPSKMILLRTASKTKQDISDSQSLLLEYFNSINTALCALASYSGYTEFQSINLLMVNIQNKIKDFRELGRELFGEYIFVAMTVSDSTDEDFIRRIFGDDDVIGHLKEISRIEIEEIPKLERVYTELLQTVRSTFDDVYSQIEQKAARMLEFGRSR